MVSNYKLTGSRFLSDCTFRVVFVMVFELKTHAKNHSLPSPARTNRKRSSTYLIVPCPCIFARSIDGKFRRAVM